MFLPKLNNFYLPIIRVEAGLPWPEVELLSRRFYFNLNNSIVTEPQHFEVVDVEGKPMRVTGYTAPEGHPGRMKILEDIIVDQQAEPLPKEQKKETRNLRIEELKVVAQVLADRSLTENFRMIRLRRFAREKGVSPEQLLREVNLYSVSEIQKKEKGEIRHFHRTSVDSLISMIQMGRMLSRSKLRELRPDLQLPAWSASDNVLMTRDQFDADGKLVLPGFHNGESYGASGSGVLMVFKDTVMQNETYNAVDSYPSVADLPIEEHCEVILVDSQEDRKKIEETLRDNSRSIPVMMKSEWRR